MIHLIQYLYHYLQHHRKVCYMIFNAVETYTLYLLVEAKMWIFGQITWSQVMEKINLIGDLEQVFTNWIKLGGGAVIVILVNKYFPKLLSYTETGISRWKKKRKLKKLIKKHESTKEG